MDENRYDLMVAGMGPAGITAAVFAQRLGLKTVVFGDVPGGSVYMIEALTNFPGLVGDVSGTQFGTLAFAQAQQEGAFFPMARLQRLSFREGLFRGIDVNGSTYRSPAAIAATGRTPKLLPGIGTDLRGVHFCSVCDGPLYRDKNAVLAVVGGTNAAAQHALTIARVAREVIMICRLPSMPMDAAHRSQVDARDNITTMESTTVTGLRGSGQVEAVLVTRADGSAEEIPVDGVFLAVGWQPNTDYLDMAVDRNAEGYLITGGRLMTSFAGLFAAGDVRDTDLYQVLTACADGARAASHVMAYLNQR